MARLWLPLILALLLSAGWLTLSKQSTPEVRTGPKFGVPAPGLSQNSAPFESSLVIPAPTVVTPPKGAAAPAFISPEPSSALLAQTTALGWQALNAGRFQEALLHFQSVVDGGPPEALFGLAVAYDRLQQPDEALLMAHQAAARLPHRADVWQLLGQLSYDAGDLGGAVKAWQQAVSLGPDAGLSAKLAKARHDLATDQRYFVGETVHFRTRFEGPEEGYLAERVLDLLEAAYSSVGLALGYYPDTVIETILYTQQAFHDVTRSPGWAGGVYDGKVRLPISGADQDPQSLRRVVTHEYVHAALADLLGRRTIPTGLHEGVAMSLEPIDRKAMDRWARGILSRHTEVMPLERISGSLMGLSAAQADRAYAQSYVMVRAMIERFGMFRLADLLKGLDEDGFDHYFQATYGESADVLLGRAMTDFFGG